MLAHLVNLQELGVTWAALNDPAKLQSLKDSLMACTARLSLERIGSLLAAVRRWHRWAVEHGVTPRAPTPLELSEFYRSVASGGPTAASSLFQALKWFESNYGVPFHCAHYLIQPCRLHAASHEGRQGRTPTMGVPQPFDLGVALPGHQVDAGDFLAAGGYVLHQVRALPEIHAGPQLRALAQVQMCQR